MQVFAYTEPEEAEGVKRGDAYDGRGHAFVQTANALFGDCLTRAVQGTGVEWRLAGDRGHRLEAHFDRV